MKFEIIQYKQFQTIDGTEKTIEFLKNGDFKSAQIKKLTNSNYFRAKINYEDRLIFTFLKYQEKTYIALLETILNHDYNKSQFLRDKKIAESNFDFKTLTTETIPYLNDKKELYFLNKLISFNAVQEEILHLTPPLIVVGSAGSGKTSVTIEKLRSLEGKVLYISLSQYLVENSKEICGVSENIDFLSFANFIEKVEKQTKKEIDFQSFKSWAYMNNIQEVEKYFEEFKGVLTADENSQYISKEQYSKLGIKQSLFTEREEVYKLFEKYLKFLEEKGFYDNNLIVYTLLKKVKKEYDFVVIDEIQDFTAKEIAFILKSLQTSHNFILSGDANQIIYSNFFSWSKIKTLLQNSDMEEQNIKILKQNFRNSQKIAEISNNLLKIKQLRFGSIDRESNYLVETVSEKKGAIHFYKATSKNIIELNNETKKSVEFAIIVFDESSKKRVKESFHTPLVFTVHEAKGLEYQNIILVNFLSDNHKKFYDITKDISASNLEKELVYNRAKDKTDKEFENYKIYINSLYVAFTRGIENLYIVESGKHRILEVLGVVEEEKESEKVKESSKEEWKVEAKHLEKVGKIEQSEAIEKQIEKEQFSKEKIVKKKSSVKVIKKEKKSYDLDYYLNEIFELNIITKSNKDKCFKLAKKENNIVIIQKLADEINLKVARLFLDKVMKSEKVLLKEECKKIIDFTNKGDFERVKELVEKGCNVDFREDSGLTALDIASSNGNKEIVTLLIKSGANIDIQSNGGWTPLHSASENAQKEIVTILIENGADVNCQTNDGVSPLFMASKKGNREIITLLIKKGADVNLKTNNGLTPLYFASEKGHKDIVKLLVRNGSNINLKNNENGTSLHIASQNGHNEVAKFLIENSADINLKTKNGNTALSIAYDTNQTEVISLLQQAGAKE